MSSAALLLAHAGAGSSWQAMVVVAGVLLAAALVAGAAGVLVIERPDDLTLPVAGTAVLCSLAVLADDTVSDAVGWGLPVAVVSLVALVLAALTPLDLRFPSPLPMGALALALVSVVVLHQPLTIALHPPVDLLPLSDDAAIVVAEPTEGATVEAGPLPVTVTVTGATIGPGALVEDDLPQDSEEAGTLIAALEAVEDDGSAARRELVDVELETSCTLTAPCERANFTLDVEPGTYELTVEFARGDGTPLSPFVRDRVTFTAQ